MPTVGEFAAKVTVVNPQVKAPVWSGPALAVVGSGLNVITTSSVDGLQGALVIVQRSV